MIARFLVETSKPAAAVPIHVEPAGEALRRAVFDRIAETLSDTSTVLIAPDGEFCLLPFEALPSATGGVLLDDYRFGYLSCGRDLVSFGATPLSMPSPSIVAADPAFNLTGHAERMSEPADSQMDNQHALETVPASRVSIDLVAECVSGR